MPGTGLSTRDTLAAGAQTLPSGFYSLVVGTYKPAAEAGTENITRLGQAAWAAVGGASNQPPGVRDRRGRHTEAGRVVGGMGIGKFLPGSVAEKL